MDTVKIKPTDEKTQGSFVLINECDFDKDIHELFKKERKPRAPNKPKINAKQEGLKADVAEDK